MTVAQTILSQLGGSRFVAMTGAKNLAGGATSLQMKIGKNAKKVTHVKVELTAADDYTVTFYEIRGTSVWKVLATVEGVYCDNLREVFTRYTGLYTSLNG